MNRQRWIALGLALGMLGVFAWMHATKTVARPSFTPTLSVRLQGAPLLNKPSLADAVEKPRAELPAFVAQVERWRVKYPSDVAEGEAIKARALALSDEDVQRLTQDVINSDVAADTRWAAFYLVSHSGTRSQGPLTQIVRADFEPSSLKPEVPLRIAAVESLDQLAAQGANLREFFFRNAVDVKDPTVRMLSLIALRGIDQGRPGKIGRVMDYLLRSRRQTN